MSNKPSHCPECGASNIMDMQKMINVTSYRCNSCFSFFSDTSGTMWHKTHLTEQQRQAIVEAHDAGLSCNKAAQELNLSRSTITRYFNKLDGIG